MRKIALVLAAIEVSACVRNPFASSVPISSPYEMSSPLYGPNFLHIAASANLWEVQSSRLALQVSADPAVRSFAEMIIADHTMLAGDMAAAGKAAGALPPPPEALMPFDQAKIDQLRATPASSFDVSYRSLQIAAHQQAISLFQTYAAQGDNPILRAMASRALPMFQKHLAAAQALPVSALTPVGAVPPPTTSRGERG
jgi:putative membrane protein